MSPETYRGASIRDAIFEEIAWSKVEELQIVQLRICRSTPEGFVVATALSQRHAVWLAERKLIPVAFCEDSKREQLREITLHPADWAKLQDELLAVAANHPDATEYRRPAGNRVTRVYDIPVVTFIR